MSFVVLPPASGMAEMNPVGGFVAGPLKTIGIYKGFQPVERVVVNFFPFR